MNKTIAIDFDGTLAEFGEWIGDNHIGKPIDGGRESVQRLKDEGYVIIIYTCRGNLTPVKEWLDKHKIPYDYLNENPHQPESISPNKMYADLYIDDRGVHHNGDWEDTLKFIEELNKK